METPDIERFDIVLIYLGAGSERIMASLVNVRIFEFFLRVF